MGRIRTIKPEFPQSETIGQLSREARLLFVQIWTIADDAGRARAAPRMLSGLLYPYDGDIADLLEGWLAELETFGCIRRYTSTGGSYLDIPGWLTHQKIDRPSKSRLPGFVEPSTNIRRGVAEPSTTDHRSLTMDRGPWTGDHGPPTYPSQERPGNANLARTRTGPPVREAARDTDGDSPF